MKKETTTTKKSLITEEYCKELAMKNKKPAACGTNVFLALKNYADSKKRKLTFSFVERIPDAEIESIPGIKKVGHKLVTAMQKDAAKLA